MALAGKKLQAEIDKTIKRIGEGVEEFTETFEKLQNASNLAQKEKYEGELKRQIKKLQRERDTIKTWLGSNDIKDKSALVENRKLIEQQMERFKAVERELKTKAYSKEGLNAAAKLDPQEKEKQELASWVSDIVERLNACIDKLETEQEVLLSSGKKGKKLDSSKQEKLTQLEKQVERHKLHQSRLEVVLRMLENGNLTVEDVGNIKEDVEYYVEQSEQGEFPEDEDFYDDLNLEDAEVFGIPVKEESASDEEEEEVITSPKEEKKKEEPMDAKKKEEPKKVKATPTPTPAPPVVKTPVIPPITTTKTQPQTPATPPAPTPKTAFAAAAARATAATTVATQPALQPAAPPPPPIKGYSAVVAAGTPTTPVSSVTTPPVVQAEPPKSVSPVGSPAMPKPPKTATPPATSRPPSVQGAVPTSPIQKPMETDAVVPQQTPMDQSSLPSSLQELVSSFEATKSRSKPTVSTNDAAQNRLLLDASYSYLPEQMDWDRPRHYLPKGAPQYPPPLYYPQLPSPVFDDPAIYEKLDIDTLFFIFYYQQNTLAQYLAARELKRQSWRFHKKYLTWFQRHEEPKQITEEYEQGTYIYFDYEGAWCQRKKADFRFEYKFLEDEN